MWTKNRMQALLDESDLAVRRAVLTIYHRQTADEQASGCTRNTNGEGFSKWDAEIMTSFAQRLLRGWTLTPKQMAVARNRIKRYHRQLCEVANAGEGSAGRIEAELAQAHVERPPFVQPAPEAVAQPEFCEDSRFDEHEAEAAAQGSPHGPIDRPCHWGMFS